MRLGYRYVETDVHATADGVLRRLPRRPPRPGHRPHRAHRRPAVVGGASRPGSTASEPIPLLEDLLGTWPDVRVNIDPKHDAAVEPLADVARAHRQPSTGCASGPSPTGGWPGCARRLGPRLCTSLGPARHGPPARWPASALPGRAVRGGLRPGPRPPGPACPSSTRASWPPPTGGGCRSTCGRSTTPAEMERLLDLGVDGIMTDRPAVLKEVLERGASGLAWWSCRSPRSTSSPGPGGCSPTGSAWSTATVRRDLRASSPSGATGWPGRCATSSACAPGDRVAWLCGNTPRAARGVLRRAAGRRRCCCRSTSGWRRPSSRFVLDDSGAVGAVPPPRPARRRPRPSARSCSATSTRRCWPASRRSRSRRPTSTSGAGRALLHERHHGRPEGRGAHPPQPVPARRALGAHQRPHPATTSSSTPSRSSTSTAGARRTTSPASAACT